MAPEAVADELVALAGWSVDESLREGPGTSPLGRLPGCLAEFQRDDLGDGIAHYSVQVRFGSGPFERIGLHRVVQERRPGIVGRKLENIFLLHGDAKNFTGMFLPGIVGASTPDDFGLAIHLARNGVDVWGMDQGWCFIPADQTDQSVGEGWGLQRTADDLRLGVAIARAVRLLTAGSGAPMNVLGYSSGVPTIYAAANDEAVLPRAVRSIGGLIPVDFYHKTDIQTFRDFWCADLQFVESLMEGGDRLLRVTFDLIAEAYVTDPDGASELFPGFTNDQVFWYFTTFAIFGEETFHYFGAMDPGPDGFFDTFRFVEESWVVDFVASGIKYQPLQFFEDYDRLFCDQEDVPWDDNLHLVEVPILNLAARGGVDRFGEYTLSLTGSTDVTSIVVSLLAPELVLEDFGHIDMFLSPLAEELAWDPLLEWIRTHVPRPGRGGSFAHDAH